MKANEITLKENGQKQKCYVMRCGKYGNFYSGPGWHGVYMTYERVYSGRSMESMPDEDMFSFYGNGGECRGIRDINEFEQLVSEHIAYLKELALTKAN